MSLYYFGHASEDGTIVSVQLDDTDTTQLCDVMSAFRSLLLAATFHPDTIAKYIDIEKIYVDQIDRL